MHWDVSGVRVEPDWTLFIRFSDGLSGRARFMPGFFTGVFEPLRDPSRFAQAFVDHGAVAWPGELDLAPDALYSQIKTGQDCILTGEPADALV